MLTELCKEIKNWFEQKKYFGNYVIENNMISSDDAQSIPDLQEGQYFRIVGSVFNDGVWKYSESGITGLKDEKIFRGAIWAMAVPQDVIDLANDIKDWSDKYEAVGSNAMSPFNSESFGGYSYSKSGGGSSTSGSGSGPTSWKEQFASRLNRWRKI